MPQRRSPLPCTPAPRGAHGHAPTRGPPGGRDRACAASRQRTGVPPRLRGVHSCTILRLLLHDAEDRAARVACASTLGWAVLSRSRSLVCRRPGRIVRERSFCRRGVTRHACMCKTPRLRRVLFFLCCFTFFSSSMHVQCENARSESCARERNACRDGSLHCQGGGMLARAKRHVHRHRLQHAANHRPHDTLRRAADSCEWPRTPARVDHRTLLPWAMTIVSSGCRRPHPTQPAPAQHSRGCTGQAWRALTERSTRWRTGARDSHAGVAAVGALPCNGGHP